MLSKYMLRIVVFCIIVCTLAGCSRNLSAGNDLVLVLAREQWVVSHFNSQGKDETGAFNGIVFNFKQNGQLFVHQLGNSIEASWVVIENTNRMHINLGPDDTTNKPLGTLTNVWQIVSHSDKLISLKDIATGSEMLEFSPN